ncbi:MAG: type IV secretory system conjugative DNA transfer family protein [Ruminococcus sp.]|nr:type IV secretory system conjugative DNA transfer family protein [Ruminococcus sp.]
MAKPKDDMEKRMPKKKSLTTLFIGFGIALVIFIIAMYTGYVAENVSPKKINAQKIFSHYTDYLSLSDMGNMIKLAVTGDGSTNKSLLLGLVGGALGFAMFMSTENSKRYHRKGEEHGSARWGNDKEKRIIQDPYDFYNNVICGSDVLLVLDRGKRDRNEAAHSGKKKNSKEKPKKKKGAEVVTAQSAMKEEQEKGNPTDEDYHDGTLHITEVSEEEKEATKEIQKQAKGKTLTVAQVAAMAEANSKIKPMLNLNKIIVGGSGTGKSRFYVKPNLMQCNTSFVLTDPSGELLRDCGQMLKNHGYKIKVFNLDDMSHSCNYNPFHYLGEEDGKPYTENNVVKMINAFMMNTKGGDSSGGDPFWEDSTKLLLSAICFLLCEKGTPEEQNFAHVLEYLHLAAVDTQGKEKSDLDLIFEKRREENPTALSLQYYDEFKQAAPETMQSILISTSVRLQSFKLEAVRNLTDHDNIHLEELGNEKQALFIIIPSSDTTFNFLAAMMYTQLFDTLYNVAIHNPRGKLDCHVRFILDEFANVGKIPEFEKVLATCRKFEISAVAILQNLSQLKAMYKEGWEQLCGNCDTMIFLGGKDQFTNEYMSKDLGKETIDTLSTNKSKGKQGSTSYNDGILGRELMTPDELSKMDNNDCLVMVRGLPPFYTHKYSLNNHPRYEELNETGTKEEREAKTYRIEKMIETEPESVEYTIERLYDTDEVYDADDAVKIEIVDSEGNPHPKSIRELYAEEGIPYTEKGQAA